jgi:hypothetical protein
MSWIKPNFLWMMFRSGWGEGQEIILGLRLRPFFDSLLVAVASSWHPSDQVSNDTWPAACTTAQGPQK